MIDDDYFFIVMVWGFFIPFVASLVLTGFSIILASRFKLLAIPDERSSHTKPTPRIGGVGPVLTAFILIFLASRTKTLTEESVFFNALFLGGMLAFFLGLVDDVFGLSPLLKLFGQFTVASTPVFFNIYLKEINYPLLGNIYLSEVAAIPLTILWIVFFINAFNFMDGMDGKAASFTIIVVATMLIFDIFYMRPSWLTEEAFFIPDKLIIIIGALAGFLIFNYPPARTFLGDGGSQFFGFMLAYISVYFSKDFVAFLILLLPFIYDVLFTLFRRLLHGENLLKAHRSHLYQRLMIIGYSHWQVLRICELTYLFCAGFSVSYLLSESALIKLLSILASLLTMLIYTLFVWYKEKALLSGVLKK